MEPTRVELDPKAASGDLRDALRGHAKRAKKTFGALARHLLFKPSDDQLADAIDRSSFERLREQEEKEGFRERPEKAERFFREGRAEQWKEVLTPQQIQRIIDAHGEQMQRFGYLPL
jgi:hypothetical protein